MADWIRLALDLVLIVCVGAGLIQATRLMRHFSGLRQGREDMERFVREFNSTVARAETGIKELRYAARESGDDLEKLVDKAIMARDELQFLVESADQIAERLSQSATRAVQSGERPEAEVVPLQERKEPARNARLEPETTRRNEERKPGTQPSTPAPPATRTASNVRRPEMPSARASQPNPAASTAALSTLAAKIAEARATSKASPSASSRAEQELLQALQNLR